MNGGLSFEKYPPLIVYKDVGAQTHMSYSQRSSMSWSMAIGRNLIIVILSYFFVCILVMHSVYIQSTLVYCHLLRNPFISLSNLEKLDLSQARNIRITTSDNITIRGWHLLPPGEESIAASNFIDDEERNGFFESMLARANRIVVFLHGNVGDRSLGRRIPLAKHLAAHLSANVLVIDYRGFGDSEGWPSEEGTLKDAYAAINWVFNHISNEMELRMLSESSAELSLSDCSSNDENCGLIHVSPNVDDKSTSPRNSSALDNRHSTRPAVYLYGQSLGAAVALQLAAALQEGELRGSLPKVHGVILDAAFSTLAEATRTHPVGAFFRIFPGIAEILISKLHFHYRNVDKIASLSTPLLLLHGRQDTHVPPTNSRALYNAVMDYRSAHGSDNDGRGHHDVRLVEIEGAGHVTCFRTRKWIVEVPRFLKYCESSFA